MLRGRIALFVLIFGGFIGDAVSAQDSLDAFRRMAAQDARLAQKVTLAVPGDSFADFCRTLSAQTGIAFTAESSVADDNLALFCKERSLSDIMLQIARHFRFSWARDGEPGAYHYALFQERRAQQEEEELRRRSLHQALDNLDRGIETLRKYKNLTPIEAAELAQSASPEEKHALERMSGTTWALVQLFDQLTPDDKTALLNGSAVVFGPMEGARPLSAEMERRVLQTQRSVSILLKENGYSINTTQPIPGGLPPAAIPGMRAAVELRLQEASPGRISLRCGVSVQIPGASREFSPLTAAVITGEGTSFQSPRNAVVNARFAGEASLHARVTVQPATRFPTLDLREAKKPPVADWNITSADLYAALHQASGRDLIGDCYSVQLYQQGLLDVRDRPLFDALNRIGDRMRSRWSLQEGWITFRSLSWHFDRPQHIPNRLFAGWEDSRQKNGRQTVNDLMEIAQLPDDRFLPPEHMQLAVARYGLTDWWIVQNADLRLHWRFVGSLSPLERRDAFSRQGLRITTLPEPQQRLFVEIATGKLFTTGRYWNPPTAHTTPAPEPQGLRMAGLRLEFRTNEKGANGAEPPPAAQIPENLVFHYYYALPNSAIARREVRSSGIRAWTERAPGTGL